jgi:2-haloacid dehalogenase
MKNICVFDVNETLLDLQPIHAELERVSGNPNTGKLWFGQLIQSALVSTITGEYKDFGTIGGSALDMVAEQQGLDLSDDDKRSVLGKMRELPPHPEVPESLDRLKKAGFTLVTLTNSTDAVVRAQLKNSGLETYFDDVFSADEVKRLKPAAEPYAMVADHLGVAVTDLCLVAAHAWDIAGAAHAGYRTAFIARPGKVADPLAKHPDIVGSDLASVVDQLLAQEGGQA